MPTNPILLFFALLIGHALCDYPLQGDFLARGKNRFNPLPGVPWYWCLGAHAAIHAGAVWMVTGWWQLGAWEFVLHCLIDDFKCSAQNDVQGASAAKYLTMYGIAKEQHAATLFNVDQTLHVVCKFAWVLIWVVAN